MPNFAVRDSLLGLETKPTHTLARMTGLDKHGIVGLQRQTLKEQDEGLEKLKETVLTTKHIAFAANEELDLQMGMIVRMMKMEDGIGKSNVALFALCSSCSAVCNTVARHPPEYTGNEFPVKLTSCTLLRQNRYQRSLPESGLHNLPQMQPNSKSSFSSGIPVPHLQPKSGCCTSFIKCSFALNIDLNLPALEKDRELGKNWGLNLLCCAALLNHKNEKKAKDHKIRGPGDNLETLQDKKLKGQLRGREELHEKSANAVAKIEKKKGKRLLQVCDINISS